VALNLTAISVTGANMGDFIAVPACSLPALLPTGSKATCLINVSFAPTASGPRQATLSTTTDTAGTQSTLLTGIGVAVQSGATLAPTSLSFPSTMQGATSAGQTVMLTSSGAATLHISSVVMAGANPGDFSMTSGCSGAYAANATCNISVTFSPLGDGVRAASITITDDTPGSPQTVPLSGTGAGAPVGRPAVTLAPSAVSFAAIGQGSISPAQSITITNSGTAALHVSSVQMSGANAGDFAMMNGCTAAAYAVSATCTIGLTFTPSAAGVRAATLAISDDAAGGTQTVALSGTGGNAPFITISTAAVSFAGVAVGTTSPPQNITITNSGSGTLHFSSVKLSGANASDFSMSNGCTAAAYPVNTACTVGLTFTPSATGTRTAALTITDDAPNSPQTVAVSGNANNLLTVSGGSLAATVTAGQTATFNLHLTSGFNGSVGFTCAGAPISATCSVPTTIHVTSGVAVPLVITVATTGGSATGQMWWRRPTGAPFGGLPLPYLLVLYLLAGSTFFGMALKALGDAQRSGAHSRLAYGAAFMVFAALAPFTVAGCGGASSVAQSVPITQRIATPAGISTISVTPTATNTTGTPLAAIAPIQLTLTVN
jgi:Abnormal spindle-like microcephaly-assoc'd, ASPM-SPD-2-Hydin